MVRLAVSMGLALQSPYLRRRISFNFAEIAGCKRRVAAPASQHGGAPLQRGRPARTWEFSPGASMHTLATGSLQALRAQTPEAQALQAMPAALRAGHPLAVAYSGGKDSSVLANLALAAACQVLAEGGRAVLAVTHADVGAVENPEIRALVRGELACMRRFAAGKGVDLRVRIARPALSESFAVRVIGGRALPAFPDSRRDCTSSWKREPTEREPRPPAPGPVKPPVACGRTRKAACG